MDCSGNILWRLFDVSRHCLAAKLAGWLIQQRNRRRGPIAAYLTARPSASIVRVLYRAGVRVLLTLHKPVVSAISEASKLGVLLATYKPRGMRIYTRGE